MTDPWHRLRFHLDLQEAFWFGLCVSDVPEERARMRRRAQDWCVDNGRVFELVRVAPEDLPSLAMTLLEGEPLEQGVTWVVASGPGASSEVWERQSSLLMMAMNERREAFRARFPGGLFVEGAVRLKVVLRSLAPDLFSVCACIIEPIPADPLPVLAREPGFPFLEPDLSPSTETGWAGLHLEPHREDATGSAPLAWLAEADRWSMEDGEGAVRSRLGALARAIEALTYQGWTNEAETAAVELESTSERLLHSAPSDRWLRGVHALALGTLAEVARVRGEVATALGLLERARDEREALVIASIDPDGSDLDAIRASVASWPALPPDSEMRIEDLASAYDGIARLHREADRFEAAAEALARSRSLREWVVEHGGARVRQLAALALCASLEGELALRRSDLDAARERFEQAVTLRRGVVAQVPSVGSFRRYLSISLGRLGVVARASGELHVALPLLREALEISRTLSASDPGNAAWAMDCSVAWSRLGDALGAGHDLSGALDAHTQALAMRRVLAGEDPENGDWQSYLAISLARTSEAKRRLGAYAEARALAHEATEIADALAWENPANVAWKRGAVDAWAQLKRVETHFPTP